MFKSLWYKVFGHPTVDGARSQFQKFVNKLENVADVHSQIAAEASALRDAASAEVVKAKAQIAKFAEWLK